MKKIFIVATLLLPLALGACQTTGSTNASSNTVTPNGTFANSFWGYMNNRLANGPRYNPSLEAVKRHQAQQDADARAWHQQQELIRVIKQNSYANTCRWPC